MHETAQQLAGWIPNGFQAMVFLWVWVALVLLYGFVWRSLNRSEPDPIRPSGPFES